MYVIAAMAFREWMVFALYVSTIKGFITCMHFGLRISSPTTSLFYLLNLPLFT